MASFVVWLVLLFGVSIGNATKDSLFPLNVGLGEEDPFMPNERDEFDDCHMRYLRYGRVDLNEQPPPPPYTENREFSHVAAIGWTQSSGTIDWDCMGALIWENFVLTSAHCTMDARNAAPDVVRLGEANPDYIQQRRISHIERHPEFEPETGRNDIALLRLERRISVNTSVAPACLWLAPDTIFPKLQSVARAKGSEVIPKHVFMLASYSQDAPAGNPLQVRLLHNYKTSPAIVGIMGGSRTAGSCRPASVYTRIGNYVGWIQEVLNGTATPVDLIPAVCALRYVHVRPREDELITERFGEIAVNDVQVEFRHAEEFSYIVRIVWPSAAGQAARNDCAGTFVDQSTILTLAECVATTPDG
ncbi:hypothetical protein ZHAS_00015606 [Anopheles sinensis]|uniref:Peptidase S1 domain-containing protein n=1 Tax=Anopheles sinensis TaxID=74873 RepID=A0A084WAW9_ANOSI|nr:hypothetical protein ZHAS_00015606 [Anopheles sinensis]